MKSLVRNFYFHAQGIDEIKGLFRKADTKQYIGYGFDAIPAKINFSKSFSKLLSQSKITERLCHYLKGK